MASRGNEYRRRVESRLCVGCGEKIDGGGVYCARCATANNARSMIRYEELKARGMCTKCGRERAQAGKTLCFDCAVMNANRASDWYRRHRKGAKE